MKSEYNFSLLKYNTFGLNVTCRKFVEYDSVEELITFVKSGELINSKWFHLGGGSNLLFLQNEYDGVVLHSKIKEILLFDNEEKDTILVRVGAGVIWDDFVKWCVERGYGGVENLSLIPGEVGAAPVQNIGAYGDEVKKSIFRVETVCVNDGSVRDFSKDECEFAYRNSFFKKNGTYIVTYVTFRLTKEKYYKYNLEYGNLKSAVESLNVVNLKNVRDAIIFIRNSKLPKPSEEGSAGSFFMNPVIPIEQFEQLKEKFPEIPSFRINDLDIKVPAGWLIESCGWKGKIIKNVGVYDKQALVIVNKGGASGEDIWNFAKEIIFSVRNKFGIDLIPEVCIIS